MLGWSVLIPAGDGVTFNSLQYAVFLPVVLAIYWVLPRRPQNMLLLFASYLFYAAWDWRFLGLMMFSTITDFVVGRLLENTDDDRRRRRIFGISLVVNLGILGLLQVLQLLHRLGGRAAHGRSGSSSTRRP